MRKRKADNCQPGQSKLFKFFQRTVDLSGHNDPTKIHKAAAETSRESSSLKKCVTAETCSIYFAHKSTSCVSPEKERSENASPKKGGSAVFISKDDVDTSDRCIDDILPPTPKSIKRKTPLGLFAMKSNVTKPWQKISMKTNVADHLSPKKIFSVNSCSSAVLSAKEVVNKDNLCTPIHETSNCCVSRNRQSICDTGSKENKCFEAKISFEIVSSQDSLIPSEHTTGELDSDVHTAEHCTSSSETKTNILQKSIEVKISKHVAHELKNDEDHFEDFLDDWDLSANDKTLDDRIDDLQLDSVKRCKVVSISDGPDSHEKILVLSSMKTKQTAKCLLRGVWSLSSRIKRGDVISIRCSAKMSDGVWVLGDETQMNVAKEMDLLVENPDILISGTNVVGSLFCPRKSVLADRFRGYEAACPPPQLMNDPNICTDSLPTEVDTKGPNSARIMLIGSLVHELLQTSLSRNLHAKCDIMKAANEILHSRKAVGDMYAAQVELHDVKKEMLNFVSNISRFMETFVMCSSELSITSDTWGKGENKYDAEEWKGSICEVKDIEENLWVPSLGLKGKIDVTVGVKIHPRSQKGKVCQDNAKIMPLELKTGRSTYSPAHQGQVLLYCMMMSALASESEVGYGVIGSGLLLYLRDESMREIHAGKYEMRDLILLRNELAHFLSCGPVISSEGDLEFFKDKRNSSIISNSLKIPISLPELPEPLNNKRLCDNCPYLTVCSAHLKCDGGLDNISKNHAMSLLVPQALKHLKPAHLDYFVHWCSLVSLENHECLQESKDYVLWTMEPLEREKQGRCVSHLVVTEVKFVSGNMLKMGDEVFIEGHIHSMIRAENFSNSSEVVDSPNTKSTSLQPLTFNVGERVLISSDKIIAISSGVVVSLTTDRLCLCLERDVTLRNGKGHFHIDKYDYLSLSSAFCLTSLGLLIEDNWSAARLRELVIDRREPKFLSKLNGNVLSKCHSFLKKLNRNQTKAVLRAISAQDFLLVRGLPGTGKTATIVAMVQVFVALGMSVLLTGHSHSSVDNVMLRLVDEGLGKSIIRLGRASSQINVKLKQYTESVLTENCLIPQELKKVYHSKMIVGMTCMGSAHPLLCTRAFDVCILDEAGQVLLPISLRPILSAKVFILVGDSQQLPPVVRGHRARILGLEETLFSVLESSEACVTLDAQYRMNSMITKLANDLSYGSSLVCANDEVADATVHIPRQNHLVDRYNKDKWLQTIFSDDINYSAVFLDTGNTYDLLNEEFYPKSLEMENFNHKLKENKSNYMNVSEAALIFYIVKAFLLGGVESSKIGIIAPYKDQVALLQKILKNVAESNYLEVKTVDQFQGRDKEIILYSFTRSGDAAGKQSKAKDLEILSDKHRLTVAITRAKYKLICIGNVEKLKTYKVLNHFINVFPDENVVSISDGKKGFSWHRIFKSLSE